MDVEYKVISPTIDTKGIDIKIKVITRCSKGGLQPIKRRDELISNEELR